MSFYIYDISFLILFSLFVILFLYKRRRKITREGIIYLYKTRLGLKFIDYFGKKYERVLQATKYLIIAVSYASMVAMIWLLWKSVYFFFSYPDIIKNVIKIPPLAPVIPYLPEIFKADFLPPFYFTYWIITLAIVAIVHEFAHGIIAKISKIKVKSTGFYFLGPFIGAFVEPDESRMKNIKKRNQIAILGAGSFSNWILTLLFFLVLWFFFWATFAPSGAIFNMYALGAINITSITGIGNNMSINLGGELNLTRVFVGNDSYFIQSSLVNQLNSSGSIIAFSDSPALNAGLNGVIVGINDNKINDFNDLGIELAKYNPGDLVKIKTLQVNDNYLNIQTSTNYSEYEVKLGKNPDTGKAYLGIALLKQQTSLFGRVREAITFFKEPNTYYSPRANPELIIFVYNLLLWIVLINFSVALGNMLPMGFVDGGRVFYLTMLAVFRNEKVAKFLFKMMSSLMITAFILLMVLWARAFF